jgi:hypothetical protein
MTLRVLTYNVHGLPWIVCPIRAVLLWAHWKTNCEVVCLQEVFARRLCEEIRRSAPKAGFRCFFPPPSECFAKKYLRFLNPSGLCILVKQEIPLVGKLHFEEFKVSAGLDALARKGILGLTILYEDLKIGILNTHFQADGTEVPGAFRSYATVRQEQEKQLATCSHRWRLSLNCGDYNQEAFCLFERYDPTHNVTFPETQQHLDHILYLSQKGMPLALERIEYFSEVDFSDHIPVMYEFSVLNSKNG